MDMDSGVMCFRTWQIEEEDEACVTLQSKVHGLGEDIGAGGWRWKICGV